MPAETTAIISAIERIGVIGILVVIVVLFLRGELFTQNMMTKILDRLCLKFEIAMKEAVRDGIDEARQIWVEDIAKLKPIRKATAKTELKDAGKTS